MAVTSDSSVPVLIAMGARGETAVRHQLEGEMVIGREAEILLADEHVSRRHAAIRVVEGRVEIEDLDSANGTQVNGRRITAATVLAHGDTLMLGDTELKVELPPAMRHAGDAAETVIRQRDS